MIENLDKKKLQNDEIDFILLFSKLWNQKKLILKTSIIFFLISIVYSLSLMNIYEASSTFYPHYSNVENSSIKSLAGIAGLNLSAETSSNVPTNLYPNLIESSPFKNNILNQKIILNNEEITYKNYLQTKNKKSSIFNIIIDYTIKLPIKLLSLIRKKISIVVNKEEIEINNKKIQDYIILSQEDYELQKILDKTISLEVNEKDGFIKLSVTDESPHIAAQIAKKSEEILQESIINYKIKNIKSVYDFTVEQLEASKKSFYNLQDNLASFKDRNQNIKTDIFLNQLNRIQKEYDIASSVYNDLALNKEKTAIEVKKNTPIFTIIDPVTLPIEKSYPKRTSIVLKFTFLGFILIIVLILIKEPFIIIKNQVLKNLKIN